MPLIEQSGAFKPPFLHWNGHLQTVLPAVFRSIKLAYQRERLELPDGDFVDLDWLLDKNKRLVVLTHGLEGNSDRQYIKGMANLFFKNGWDILAWNCRSCSGEMNRNLRLYHHGEIEDISQVVDHALRKNRYNEVVMMGFSMGGAMTLKYLGVQGKSLPDPIRRAIAFSAPCDLKESVNALEWPSNRFYKKKFLQRLTKKIKAKAVLFPDAIDLTQFDRLEVWQDFDEAFSAPINGFSSSEALYENASAQNYMADIQIPTLLVNATNDPIIPLSCTPVDLCEKHPQIYLEQPPLGGHVGFMWRGKSFAWSEYRALQFVEAEL